MAEFSRRGAGALALSALSYSRIQGANERVMLGYIGLGNRGDQVHDGFLEFSDNRTAAICDLKSDYLDLAEQKAKARGHDTPKRYADWRRVVEDKTLDAVVIATPDHWHALQMIAACNAGKDVYVEKPLSLTVLEGRKMVDAAQKNKRVVQVGIHRRSAKFLQDAAAYVQSGELGKITLAQGFHLTNEWPRGLGDAPVGPPPSEAEWDAWLGPAPKVPYNRNRMYYNFRWFYDYSGGQVTNFGVHYIDMLRWCLGKDAPRAVTTMGGKFAMEDNREIPDTLQATWDYGDAMISFTQVNANAAPANALKTEMMIRGTKGTMYLHLNRWEVVPEPITDLALPQRTPVDRNTERAYNPSKKPVIEARKMEGYPTAQPHARNFLDCMKTRAKCNCDVLDGHLSTSATLIANIAYKTKSYLEWDAKNERFPNHPAANQYLSYKYRAPYQLP
ncbi:MAG: Gfo/Idh/MocA family oxidoreductase [Bryobacter sp.]